jgi:uncharacterized repeat protein (TIGR02543 family)
MRRWRKKKYKEDFMKRTNSWIIALVAIIIFTFLGCGGNESTETFNVTFNANGGTPEPQAKIVERGGKVAEPSAMIKANSTLEGWYKESTFSNKWNFATDTVVADITLHAKWVLVPVSQHSEETITFDKGGVNEVTFNVIFEGTFTDTEWTGIVADIKNALDNSYKTGSGPNRTRFKTVFGDGVTIVVEKNPEGYTNYKVGHGFETLYLNVDSIESANYANAVAAMVAKDPTEPLMKD